MASVEIVPGEAPSASIVQDANRVVRVKDRRGRTLGIKRPGVLAQFRLIEIVGGDVARNDVYMGMALPLFWLVEIDGEAIYPPTTKAELEVLIKRVEEEGIEAIVLGISEHFEGRDGTTDQLKNE